MPRGRHLGRSMPTRHEDGAGGARISDPDALVASRPAGVTQRFDIVRPWTDSSLVSEVSPAPDAQAPDANVPADPVESIVASASRLSKVLQGEIPGWLAAELTIGQLRLLRRLSHHGPISMSGSAEWLGIGLPSVTGTVERLERHGLVERRHGTDDRRIVEVLLTDRALDLFAEMAGVRIEAVRAALGVLEPEELADLDRLFRTIIERNEGPRP